jgi:trehalose-6-phosphatase
VCQGVAVELLLRTIEKKKPVDFVLCVGDDRSDEVCLYVCLYVCLACPGAASALVRVWVHAV